MMKNNLNNHGDRFLRILFREINLEYFIIHFNNQYLMDKKRLEFKNNEELQKVVARQYHETYPTNYHNDEIEAIIQLQIRETEKHYQRTHPLDFIRFSAAQYLCMHDGKVRIKFNDILYWNGYTDKLGEDIFVCAYIADQLTGEKRFIPKKQIVEHDNQRIYKILSQGIAENHMHLNASGYGTEMNWQVLMNYDLSQYDVIKRFVSSPVKFNVLKHQLHGASQEDYITTMIYKSIIIRSYLKNRTLIQKTIETTLPCRCSFQNGKVKCKDTLHCCFQGAMDAKNEIDLRVYQEFIDFVLAFRDEKCEKPQDFLQNERDFLTKMFTYAYSKNRNSMSEYERFLFFCYLHIKSNVFLEFHQSNRGIGFDKFKTFEDYKTQFIDGDKFTSLIQQSVFERYDDGATKLVEIRMAPGNTLSAMEKKINSLNQIALPYQNRLEYGVIIHYIKHKEMKDNTESPLYYKNYDVRNIILNQVQEVEKLLCHSDEKIRKKIMAIDAANYEFTCRPEVFSQVFRINRAPNPHVEKQPVHITYHVGEEFNTLCNGLRAIDEALDLLTMKRNDRLGHALALGLDPKEYFSDKRDVIISTCQDMIDDIVWLYDILVKFQYQDYAFLNQLHSQFEHLKADLYHEPLDSDFTLNDYRQSMYLRGDNPEFYIHLDLSKESSFKDAYRKYKADLSYPLNTCLREHYESFRNDKARRLYLDYHYNPELKKRGCFNRTEEMSVGYCEAITFAQSCVREKIIEEGIYIEVNPTSNRKISHIKTYEQHPIFRFNSQYLSENHLKNIPISINTDDGAIFQTDLRNEYAVIAASLLSNKTNNYQPEDVYRYIEYLCQSSLEQSFIDPPDFTKEAMLKTKFDIEQNYTLEEIYQYIDKVRQLEVEKSYSI